MLEAMIFLCLYYAATLFPLRGKELSNLTPAEMAKVQKQYIAYTRRRKYKDISMEEFYPKLQKQGMTYLIIGLIMIPVYIAVLAFVYPALLADLQG